MEEKRYRYVLLLCIMGLAAAILAGLSEHVSWIAAACSSFGQGCKESAKFVLLGVPLWGWGAAYYVLLASAVFVVRDYTFWWVAAAAGVEASLVWIMLSMKFVCVFCLVNLLVVALLIVLCFETARFWRMLSVSLASALLVGFILVHQNSGLIAAEKPERNMIVAKVAGQEITSEFLDHVLASRIYELELQKYRIKREYLDSMIAQTVLEKEAKKRGVSLEKFLADATRVKDIRVEPEELKRYYELNRASWANWKGTEEELKARMINTIVQQKANQRIMELARSLYPEYGVEDYLQDPPLPHTRVRIGNDPSLGPANAPITVVEFSDYECPACRATHDVVLQVREIYTGKIRWVFKDFPLSKHKTAAKAAEAARCAGDQGKFWEYQDALFSSREELDSVRLLEYAKGLGLDENRFSACLNTGKHQPDLARSHQDGKDAGVDGTPSFIINGSLASGGLSIERFKELIDGELKKLQAGHNLQN